ncbi:hypothetical protein NC653_006408 [Populus alba x Populus x berolinensis]|uniref:Uncharacterized protein n=1 Tax=Populus alba x Populus x berolinensis TaxID=444605 RepID=A0AAD6REQ8_9ROSI|nr:hypothetical protein NC653_006408 [Populus alba x Populus x berolinensis]
MSSTKCANLSNATKGGKGIVGKEN